MREFKIDNDAFESWLRTKCDVVLADLDFKHQRMKTNAFVFLRATYFRWATQIEALCPDLALAPSVLSVGDTHVENFGTWRDGDGRLVWGVNDFDEVASIAYPFDLVRLATSAQLAPKLAVGTRQAVDAILSGYLDALAEPRPTIVHEHSVWMRTLVQPSDAACVSFWHDLDACPDVEPPQGVADALRNSLPPGSANIRFCSRRKGGGDWGAPVSSRLPPGKVELLLVKRRPGCPRLGAGRAATRQPQRTISRSQREHFGLQIPT